MVNTGSLIKSHRKSDFFPRLAFFFLFLSLLGLSISCSQKPTKVYQSKQGFSRLIQEKAKKPIKITANTIVIDARSRFDYTMAHYPDAEHLLWESFSQSGGRYPGRIQEDLEAARQRLQLKGLTPERPIVVVGYGTKGKGEAGRLAWTLLYFGFEDVQIVGNVI